MAKAIRWRVDGKRHTVLARPRRFFGATVDVAGVVVGQVGALVAPAFDSYTTPGTPTLRFAIDGREATLTWNPPIGGKDSVLEVDGRKIDRAT